MDPTRFQCRVCGKITAGRISRDGGLVGDSTHRFPRRHKGHDGKDCPGNIIEADWVNIDALICPGCNGPISKKMAETEGVCSYCIKWDSNGAAYRHNFRRRNQRDNVDLKHFREAVD